MSQPYYLNPAQLLLWHLSDDCGSHLVEQRVVIGRSDYDALTYQPTTIPSRVDAAVRRFMAMLHLRFAAIDFVVRPDGEWVFLEVNPNGQWEWIEQETDLPIAAAIAAELSRERV